MQKQKTVDSPALSEYGMEIIYEDPTERVDMYINCGRDHKSSE